MTDFVRYAIYHLPPDGPLARFGAAWLGWDIQQGLSVAQPDLPGIADITRRSGSYGFHATLKPPFRLAPGTSGAALDDAVARLSASCPPARADGLELVRLGRFLALVPKGAATGLNRVAAQCVTALDAFRAPPDVAELARRRKAGLTPAQEKNLEAWGYPHVLDTFRFHMTLTDRLPKAAITLWEARLAQLLPPLPAPFVMDDIALVGEDDAGRFHLIRRYALTG